MKPALLILFLGLSLISCKDNYRQARQPVTSYDTLDVPKDVTAECIEKSKGYFKAYGCMVSSYYRVIDAKPMDVNNDALTDTLVIISPSSLNPDYPGFDYCGQDNRKLVILLNVDGKSSRVGRVYDNVICNEVSRAWGGYDTFDKKADNMVLCHDAGQGCKFEYKIYTSLVQQEFYIDSIYYYSKCPGDDLLNGNQYTLKYEERVPLEYYKRTLTNSIHKVKGI
ncbi:hypothetical protein Q763_12760 [Flavobacterium beibuense F44-8]|uniref:Lipoprotein n=1 Tax=Flavobacterium beibuense F44-8 TaxID=1406840 RepID=A0A0A2LHP5_9FLAO|nr:hypothetical protein [Flavobacterium beibuense]KGO79712.1 hypothetical protein Q763_12760 [Flavobacterium beibuense F44-8]